MNRSTPKPDRRSFLQTVLAAAAAGTCDLALPGIAQAAGAAGGVPMTTIGRKKVKVSRIAVGGWHAGVEMKEDAGLEMLARALDMGINFFDSAYSYGNEGQSEKRVGKAFSKMRDRVFLMSKSEMRDAKAAEEQLTESLKRLQTDHLDLWQFHSLNNVAEAEEIARKGGAVETARKALADGRVRMLGATGHNSPEALVRILELVPEVEVIQFPVNCVDPHWISFIKKTLPEARKRGVGVLAMKTLAMGTLVKAEKITVEECHRYALSQPVDVWVSGMTSMAQLEQNVKLLKTFKPMTDGEQAELVARAEPYKGEKFETYKAWKKS